MYRRICLSALVGSAALLATLASATVSVDRVTIGTEVDLFAPGDIAFLSGTAKVKTRYVGPAVSPTGKKRKTPKLKLKVRQVNQGSVTTVVKKAKGAGLFEIEVTPKEPGAEPFIAGTVETVIPAPTDVTPTTAGRKTELVITGSFFGTKKPKVKIGGKKAKVLEFSDTELRVRTHKKTPLGPAVILVKTKVGQSGLVDALVIDDGTGGGDGDGDPPGEDFARFTAKGDDRLRFDTTIVSGSHLGAGGFTITALDNREEITLEIATSFDLDTFTSRHEVDIFPAKGDKFEVRAPDGILRAFAVVQPSNGTSGSVTVLSFDPATLTLLVDLDAELLSVDTGERISIRAGRAQVTLNDHRP